MGDNRSTDKQLSRFILADVPFARQLLERLVVPVLLLVFAGLAGTVGFMILGHGRWSFLDCLYMTSITLTTVGYGEVLDQMGSGGRVFAMVVMWSGMGVTLYAVSTITAFLVETDLVHMLKEKRMEKHISALKGHIIVCGAGNTGFNVLKELHATRRPCLVIDDDKERLQWVQNHIEGIYYLYGNATEEEILKRAGIEKAAGIIATLRSDSDNLLITVQARYVSPGIKIVARCNENSLADKFSRAGADYIVNPAFIGGMRMVSEMIRPHVVSFLDRMLRGQDQSIRVEEVSVGGCSQWVNRTLRDADIQRRTGLMPIALRHSDQKDFTYNPSPDELLRPDTVIIVIGSPSQIEAMRSYCSS
ncbi:MAG: potassium channel family protein [Syntrophobacteraceae bacterium]